MAEMDMELIKLMEDELQGMIETRQTLDIGSKEYTLLTNAIDKCEDKLAKTYKVIMDQEDAKSKLDQEKDLKTKDIELRREELNMKAQQFKADMELRREEIEQKEKSDKQRNVWTFTGIVIGGLITFGTAVWTQHRSIQHQDEWIPKIMYFEKHDNFSYSPAKAMVRDVLR